MDVHEIADRLRCSETHARKLIRGEVPSCPALPHLHIGRKIVVKRRSFERWLETFESATRISA